MSFFQKSSWSRLRGDLCEYLSELRQGYQFNSRLVQMVLASWGGSVNKEKDSATKDFFLQVVARDAEAKRLHKRYSELVHAHQALRGDYQKLIAVMKELTAGLESVTRACSGKL